MIEAQGLTKLFKDKKRGEIRAVDGVSFYVREKETLAEGTPDEVRATAKRMMREIGRDGGYTAQAADACVIIPTVNAAHTTPHSEAFQAVVWHLLVTHPELKRAETKWEAVRV